MALSLCSVMTIFAGETAYLFSYFINGSKDGLHLAYSYDGLNWMPLNGGRSYLTPSVGKDKLMRDPSICQAPDGTFHMVWTSSWTDRIIGYASSRDLIHWSEQQAIPVMMHEPTAHNVGHLNSFMTSLRKLTISFGQLPSPVVTRKYLPAKARRD